MDFVARAGAIVDRAHRMAGILLIALIVESIIIAALLMGNTSLSERIQRMVERREVYVVPGSTRGLYSPTEDDLLINAFVDTVTQSFNTFTYETLQKQYVEMRTFFSPEMLTFSQDYFDKLIRDSAADRRSQLFIPDHRSMKVDRGTEGGIEVRNVTMRGSLQTILAGSVVESVPVEISLKLQKTMISRTNPFGFQLAAYAARKIANQPVPQQPANPQPGAQ
ncbi:MAG TPA: TraE/TraK family type IV conjugative transfer system protein [Alphaproteobacteria bacterium]|nr:TraE/TraK family type IV conjugative transfer system protein [Alphaproteobacteria bacterium]